MRLEAALIASGARGAAVRKTGIGPQRARLAAGELGEQAGRAMLVLGFCGGLDDSSVPGEVIVAGEVCAAPGEGDPQEPIACDLSVALLGQLTGLGMKVRTGRLVCVSRPALAERRAELGAGGAIAVDMESAWLAAGARGRPFGVVRVVLDSPAHELLRPQAVAGALRAAISLRRVAAALHEWVPED